MPGTFEEAEERRKWIVQLVENNVIGTVTEIHRRYLEEFDHSLHFSTIRKDIKKLGLILTPHGRNGEEKRYRLPVLITGRDIEYEMIHRFRVDVQAVYQKLQTHVHVVTNSGVADAVYRLIKMALEEEVLRGVAFAISDHDDTVILFCEKKANATYIAAYFTKMLWAPPNTYSVHVRREEWEDDEATTDAG